MEERVLFGTGSWEKLPCHDLFDELVDRGFCSGGCFFSSELVILLPKNGLLDNLSLLLIAEISGEQFLSEFEQACDYLNDVKFGDVLV